MDTERQDLAAEVRGLTLPRVQIEVTAQEPLRCVIGDNPVATLPLTPTALEWANIVQTFDEVHGGHERSFVSFNVMYTAKLEVSRGNSTATNDIFSWTMIDSMLY